MIEAFGTELPGVLDSGETHYVGKRQALLQYIDRLLREVDSFVALRKARNVSREEASVLSCNVLPDAAMDRIVRYETHLMRQLNNAVLHLERIQRRRQGESVTAPLSLQIEGG